MGENLCESCSYNGGKYICNARICDVEGVEGAITGCEEYKHTKKIESVELTKTMRHLQVCKELNSLYEAKNNDYGDSFAKVRYELGNVAILVRLYDKVERLKTLLTGAKQKVNDESIDDTLKDLANYCLLELVERAVDKDGLK